MSAGINPCGDPSSPERPVRCRLESHSRGWEVPWPGLTWKTPHKEGAGGKGRR